MTLFRRAWPSLLVAVAFLAIGSTARAGEGCHPIPVSWYSPTGVAGCTVYGTGTASAWGGPGVARNDCVWPWRDCQAIAIRSLQTGLTIVVTPAMYCDCYTGTSTERIVDLDPESLLALGLNPADGLWPVEVWPVDPATGIEQRSGHEGARAAGPKPAGDGVHPAPAGALLPDTAVEARP